jgi:hypothetical protein
MPYERGDLTTTTTSGSTALEFRAVGRDATILEWGIALNAATASIFGIGYSANTPAGGTVNVGVNTARGGGAPGGGTILSGQSTPPTVPGTFWRRYGLPGAVGNGVFWAWNLDDIIIPNAAGASPVLWNPQVNSAFNTYMKWEE